MYRSSCASRGRSGSPAQFKDFDPAFAGSETSSDRWNYELTLDPFPGFTLYKSQWSSGTLLIFNVQYFSCFFFLTNVALSSDSHMCKACEIFMQLFQSGCARHTTEQLYYVIKLQFFF